MAIKRQHTEAEIRHNEIESLFSSLKTGHPRLGMTDIVEKLATMRDEAVHLRLIGQFQDTLELISPAGWHMLARYGTPAVQIKLIREFPEKLDIKITDSIPKAGWLMLSVYGSDAVKALLMDEYADKLESKEPIYKRDEKGKAYRSAVIIIGPGWANMARYGSEETQMRMINKYPRKLDLNKRHGWHLLAMHGTDAVKSQVELRRGIVR